MANITPVTNAEWVKFFTHLFPSGASCISRHGVNALLESRDIEAAKRAAAPEMYGANMAVK